MNIFETMDNKWRLFLTKHGPAIDKTKTVFKNIWTVLKRTGQWIYRLRSIFLAVPVILFALRLAVYNMQNLPEQVGINILTTGEYAQMIDRNIAVMGPLAVTALCILMMFLSRRIVYPWLISLFSLALPILIYITNVFPA